MQVRARNNQSTESIGGTLFWQSLFSRKSVLEKINRQTVRYPLGVKSRILSYVGEKI